MKKHHWQILLFIAIVVCLLSCAGTLKTGRYVVEDVKGTGYVIKLKGIDDLYNFPVNTLRVGDTVFLKRTWKQSKANVY